MDNCSNCKSFKVRLIVPRLSTQKVQKVHSGTNWQEKKLRVRWQPPPRKFQTMVLQLYK